MIQLPPHSASSNTNNTFKFKHVRSKQYKRTNCPSGTAPFHTFNQRISAQNRHRHCSAFGQCMKVGDVIEGLLPYRTLITTSNPITQCNTNVRAVRPGPTRNRSVHSNKRRSAQIEPIDCNVFGQQNGAWG